MIKGTFISHWDDNISIETPAFFHKNDGYVEIETNPIEIDGLENLNYEEIITEEGSFRVCPWCHEYIMENNDKTETCKCKGCDCVMMQIKHPTEM